MRTIDSIIVHCSATPIFSKPMDIAEYHISKLGYKYCGYHLIIDERGIVSKHRPLDEVGAHCKGQNNSSIGICLIGGRDKFDFTFDQLLTLVAQLRYYSVFYKISKDKIFSHYEFNKNKMCPQFNVKNLIKYEKGFYQKNT